MKSIFKALDGGHLDRALFSSPAREEKIDEQDPKASLTGRLRLVKRRKTGEASPDVRPRKPRSDAG